MKVTEDVVRAIADLAMLQIEESNLQDSIDSMDSILHLVEQMQSVDTSNVEPMANPLNAEQTLRADTVTETNERNRFQAIAPDTDTGMYIVPRVID